MMGDGKALQMGTSHELGQNFARAFGIQFQDDEGNNEYAWQTSWGVSTRLVGALIMAHGDDAGLRLPPRLAPVQVVVLLVRAEEGAGDRAAALVEELGTTGVRVELDDRVGISFGRRAVDWELKGVPVRIEIGPRDVATGTATLVRRDTGEKQPVELDGIGDRVGKVLAELQDVLQSEARQRRDSRTSEASSVEEAIEACQEGFALVPWDTFSEEETTLNEAGVSVRCLQREDGGIPGSPSEPGLVATLAKAY
jgi:prolyl-tRNA synthetase